MRRWHLFVVLASLLLALPATSCGGPGPGTSAPTILASKQLGPWLYHLYSVELVGQGVGLELVVEMGITNTSAQSLAWERTSVGMVNPLFIAVDAEGHTLVPINDLWHWLRRIAPSDTVRGRLRYPFHDASWPATLYLGEDPLFRPPQPLELVFPLE